MDYLLLQNACILMALFSKVDLHHKIDLQVNIRSLAIDFEGSL